jgi:hypothetical protein
LAAIKPKTRRYRTNAEAIAEKLVQKFREKFSPKLEPLLGRHGTLPYTMDPEKKKREFKHGPYPNPIDYNLDVHKISTTPSFRKSYKKRKNDNGKEA